MKTTWKDIGLIVLITVLTLTAVVTIMVGVQAIIIDTGRAILK